MADVTQLPAYIQLRYRENGVFDQMEKDAARAADRAKQRFDTAFSGLGDSIRSSLSGLNSGRGIVDIDLGQFRQAQAEAKAYLFSVEQLRDAERRLQYQNGRLTEATRARIAALDGEVSAAREAYAAAREQVTVMSQLDAEQRNAATSTSLLAQAQRELALEQARSANIASNSQRNVNAQFGLNASGGRDPSFFTGSDGGSYYASSARESARVFEEADRAAQQYARDLELVKQAIDPTRAAQQQLNIELGRAEQALQRGEIDMQQYGVAVNRAADNYQALVTGAKAGTNAQRNIINSQRASRVAFVQLGQQMQDVTVQAQLGTNAFQIFTQQVPQAAFALSGLADNANKAYARVGALATFMSGPFGAIIFAATAILGPLIYNLTKTGDAADDATGKTYDFANGLSVLELNAKQSADAMRQLANEIRGAIAVQGDFLQQKALIAGQSVTDIEGRLSNNRRLLEALKQNSLRFTLDPTEGIRRANRISQLQQAIESDREALEAAVGARADAEIAVSQSRVIERLDASTAATKRYERAVGELNKRRRESQDDPIGAQLSGVFISQNQYEVEFERLTRLRDAEQEAARESQRKRSGPSAETLARRAQRETERLARISDSAAESIARINEQFDDQPRLVDKSAQAVRKLESIIGELNDPKNAATPRRAELIREAQDAQVVAARAVETEIGRQAEAYEKTLQIQSLQAAGLERQADILTEINRLDEQLGLSNRADALREERGTLEAILTDETLTAEQRAQTQILLIQNGQELLNIRRLQGDVADEAERYVAATDELNLKIARTNDLMNAQLAVIDTARDGLRDILSGRDTDLFGNLKQAIADLRGARLFDDLFGDVFDDLESQLRKRTPLGRATAELVTEVDTASTAFETVATSAESLAARFDAVFAANDNPASGTAEDGTIVATARTGNTKTELEQLSVRQLADRTAEGIVKPLLTGFGDILGTKFVLNLQGVLQGALSGYIQAGKVGAVLGGAQGLADLAGLGGLSGRLGTALGGASAGLQASSALSALGIGLSGSGSAIGGAIGSFLPIPGGQIIGSIAGGLLGKLFGSTPRGGAIIGDVGGSLGVSSTFGNKSRLRDASSTAANDIIDSIERIAEELGAGLDPSRGAVTIGIRKGNYRVDFSGRGTTKTSRGAVDFGEDAEAAAAAATLDLIRDGVLVGLRAGTQRLLQQGDDLEAALQDALDFESVFSRLKTYKDPVGAALDTLDKEFTRLIDLFDAAGASSQEYADLEELYNIERAKAVQQANETILGSLRALNDDLTVNNDALSLRTRQAAAQEAYDPLAARVAAGDVTAYDDFADAARNLLEIERELYGSQQEYFDRLNSVRDLTTERIAAESNVASIAENRDSPFDAAGRVQDAIDNQTNEIVGQLSALNDNFATWFAQQQANGTPVSQIPNFGFNLGF